VETAAFGPDEAFAVEVGPFPIGAVDGFGGVGAHERVPVVIDAFAFGVVDAGVAEFAECPSGAGGFFENGRSVVVRVGRELGAQGPAIALEAVEVNVEAFAAVVGGRLPGFIASDARGNEERFVSVAVVEPVAGVGAKESAAVPAVAFAEEGDGFEIGRIGNGGPRALGLGSPATIHGEIDQVFAVGGEIGAAFVDASAQPLADGERVLAPIPADGAGDLARPAPEDDGVRRVTREKHVEARRELRGHGRAFDEITSNPR